MIVILEKNTSLDVRVSVVLRTALLVATVLAGAITNAENTSGITLVVGIDAVSVANVPIGGSVVLFTVQRTSRSGGIHLHDSAEVLTDDDRDGVVRFVPEKGVPLRSIWVAAELGSGAHAVASHPEFPLYARPLTETNLRKDAQGAIATLEMEIPRLMLLLVSPGKGAWVLKSTEGGRGDGDAVPDGQLSMVFEQATSVDGKEKAPKHLKAGDFIAVVNPGQLDVWTAEVGK